MRFRVHTTETITVRRSKVFVAESATEAETLAENEDWREWERDEQDAMSCSIVTVVDESDE